jgi:hypothetical protein
MPVVPMGSRRPMAHPNDIAERFCPCRPAGSTKGRTLFYASKHNMRLMCTSYGGAACVAGHDMLEGSQGSATSRGATALCELKVRSWHTCYRWASHIAMGP